MCIPETFLNALFVVLMLCLTLSACEKSVSKSEVQGEVTIRYSLNAWDHPTVIWLSDGEKNYLNTIYVSDWLSNSGYLLSYVCPQWSSVSDWQNVTETEVDAVTSATPEIGIHEIILNCKEEDMVPGEYYYLIESHVQNEYNLLYTGKLSVGDASNSSVAEVSYIPEAHPDSVKRNVLSGVSAEYRIIDN
jgi:hypothetical protein